MKKIFMIVMATFFVSVVSAKIVKTSFVVNGKCDLCKMRIEKAAKKVDGVKAVSWNVQSHKLILVYDNIKTSPKKVQQVIAKVGHDTSDVRASAAAYNSLPSCCKYR